jgi:2,3-bisphosphoglycerate-dependent phosphoglycerate mutase
MELLLIRHALPQRVEGAVGPADPQLSEAGHAQAQRLADYLSTESLDAIYASPLRRARETAAPLLAGRDLEVRIEDGIAEYDRTSSNYVPIEELKAAGGEAWKRAISGPHGTNLSDFRERVFKGMAAIVDAHPGQKVAVVCHAGVIGTYLADVLGIVLTGPSFFTPNYTSISRVLVARSGNRGLFTMNETSHLRGTGLPIGIYG